VDAVVGDQSLDVGSLEPFDPDGGEVFVDRATAISYDVVQSGECFAEGGTDAVLKRRERRPNLTQSEVIQR
jgi:hypothetical protein